MQLIFLQLIFLQLIFIKKIKDIRPVQDQLGVTKEMVIEMGNHYWPLPEALMELVAKCLDSPPIGIVFFHLLLNTVCFHVLMHY